MKRLQEQIKEVTKDLKIDQIQLSIKNSLLLSICFLYILNFFINDHYIQFFLSILTIIAFILCVIKARTVPRIFALLMFGIGIVMFIMKGQGVQAVLDGIILNLPLLTLIMLVPLISIPFKIGGFFQTILYYLKKMATHSQKMFLSISTFLFCFGPILNLGSIRIVNEMVKDLRLNPILLAKAYLVGFSTVILWSPYFASVALVLYYLKLNVGEYIYLGLSLAVIQLVIGNLLYSLYYNRVERHQRLSFRPSENIEQMTISTEDRKGHFKKMISLLLILLLLMFCLFMLEHITKWPMMLLVSLIAIFFPLIFCLITRKWEEGKGQLHEFYSNVGKSINNEAVMFTSAGVFASSLTGTTFADSINGFLTDVADTSFLLFCVTIVFMIVFLTYLGLHTIVVVTVLIIQLDPITIGTTPAVLALLFMISWSVSAVLSPVNPLNLLVSGSVGKSSVIVGLKWNGLYVLTMFIVGVLFVYFIH